MTDKKIRCMRCKGRKKMYKVRGAYSHTNTGGIEVQCPMCNGEGKVKSVDDAIKDVSEKKEKINPPRKKVSKKFSKFKNRDLLDG